MRCNFLYRFILLYLRLIPPIVLVGSLVHRWVRRRHSAAGAAAAVYLEKIIQIYCHQHATDCLQCIDGLESTSETSDIEGTSGSEDTSGDKDEACDNPDVQLLTELDARQLRPADSVLYKWLAKDESSADHNKWFDATVVSKVRSSGFTGESTSDCY